jgi:hypothetical protein
MFFKNKNKKKKKAKEFYEAWWFLAEHPDFVDEFGLSILDSLNIEVVKVNPLNNRISDNKIFNTKTMVWLEWGPKIQVEVEEGKPVWAYSHDTDLDCGGDTFEEAIIALAKLVEKKYGWLVEF